MNTLDNYTTHLSVGGKYLAVYMPNHPDAMENGDVYEHRLVASKMLNRLLKKSEYVHHKDENGLNNKPENLMVFNSVSDHSAYHMGRPIYCKNGIYYADRTLINCSVCGKQLIKRVKTGMCKKCYNNLISKKPDIHTLEELLKKNNYSEIARKYGVTPNSVKKWAKNYGLYTYCFYDLPNKNEFCTYILNNSKKQVSLKYNVDMGTINRWLRVYNIEIIPECIKCVETNICYANGRDVIRQLEPSKNAKSSAEILRKVINTKNTYLGYHWVTISKKIIVDNKEYKGDRC